MRKSSGGAKHRMLYAGFPMRPKPFRGFRVCWIVGLALPAVFSRIPFRINLVTLPDSI